MTGSKKTLATRSDKYILLYSMLLAAASLLTAVFFVKFSEEKDTLGLILVIIFALADVALLFTIFKTSLSPRVMIEHDDFGIYLNYRKKTIYLPYKDIYYARAENTRARGVEYSFGHLCIIAGEEYKIGAIKDAKAAADFINKKIAWKYSTKKSYRKKY